VVRTRVDVDVGADAGVDADAILAAEAMGASSPFEGTMKTLEQRVYGCPQMGRENSLRNSKTRGYRSKIDGICLGN